MRLCLRSLPAFLIGLLLIWSAMAFAAPENKTNANENPGAEATLTVFNRPVAVFRTSFLGLPPSVRVSRARAAIEEILRQEGDLTVTVKSNPEGQLVLLNDRLVFVVVAGDADQLTQETPEAAAKKAVRNLEQIVAETREARDMHSLLRALTASAIATLVFALVLWAWIRLRRWVGGLLLFKSRIKVDELKMGGTPLIERQHMVAFIRRLQLTARWLVLLLLTYEWLSFVLSRFPYTRPWGERLNDYLLSVAQSLLLGMLDAIPGLGVAVAIFVLARVCSGFLGRFFERVSRSEQPASWLLPETMPTTRRLFNIAIWLFAIAMAYPYLPGAQTDAFKGLSVLLGLMVSLGATNIVGQGAAGLILTYTRTIRRGEYVRVGEHEGTVVEMGMFTTRIQTGLGEELTLPNSLITGSVTKNYSRAVQGRGYIVDTTVTIGYDTPWRQVEAMLIEAAKRTPGVLSNPYPIVFQTGLSDYYPEYRLVAQAIPSSPRPRAEVLSALHANIQDVFNQYGVQIMSPHYMTDPQEAKVVKPEDWFPEPVNREMNKT